MQNIAEIYEDYADGIGSHGTVLKEFSEILASYKKNFQQWLPYDEPRLKERQKIEEGKPKRMLITAAIVLGLFLILRLIGMQSFLDTFVFVIVASIFMKKYSEDMLWLMLPILVMFVILIIGAVSKNTVLSTIVYLIILGVYAYFGWQKHEKEKKTLEEIHSENKERIIRKRDIEKKLTEDRNKMLHIYPYLQAEYKELYDHMKNNQTNYAAGDLQKYEHLPKSVWWMVEPNEIAQWEKALKENRVEDYSISWEFKCIQNDGRIEYVHAPKEFSPLYDDVEMDDGDKENIYQLELQEVEKDGGVIADFIALVLTSSQGNTMVTYSDYKYSDLQRLSKSMEWSGIKGEIDCAYRMGELLQEDYNNLIYEYNRRTPEVYEHITQKELKQYQQKIQVKSSTYLWTGQILLIPDKSVQNGYCLVDYYCQFQHLFENLEALKRDYDMRITRILGGREHRNAMFMAKMHQLYPECR